MGEFANKVVLITGGTSGIGEAAAVAFAKEGAHVVVTGRRVKEGEAVAEKVRKHGVRGVFVQADVSVEADIQRAVREAEKITGRIDVAFNNAGVEGDVFVPVTEQTDENYAKVFEINVKGVLLSMKYEIASMLRTGGGSIVNTSSVAGRIGMGGMSVYVASKHAVNGLSKCAALEVATKNIRVNVVSPAAIQTEMFDRFIGNDAQKLAGMAAAHPIGRVGKPEEIADAVVWLSSSKASFVTGHDLLVDGGYTVP